MSTLLTPVAFDIETTGFAADAHVTVVGFALPLGCRLFLNTGGCPANTSALEDRLENASDSTVRLTTYDTEADLLSALTAYGTTTLSQNDYLLVAYNGDHYHGGFDLPFLRTRYARNTTDWPFVDLAFADLYPLCRNRFNLQIDERDATDLGGAYDVLTGGTLGALDPFETSEQAVTAFEAGAFEPLLQHNLADLLRTQALALLAERYCAKSEFRVKSLAPTNRRAIR